MPEEQGWRRVPSEREQVVLEWSAVAAEEGCR
jgi:hypothetical protein